MGCQGVGPGPGPGLWAWRLDLGELGRWTWTCRNRERCGGSFWRLLVSCFQGWPAVGGTWDIVPFTRYTNCNLNVLGAGRLKKKGKEPAATAKTSFLQDSTQERGARLTSTRGAFPNLPVPGYLSNITVLVLVLLAELGTTRAQRQAFLGTAGRGETWARFKRTKPQMAWDVSSLPTGPKGTRNK